MKLIEVSEINPVLIDQLLEVWDRSVRETHLFLSDSETKNIAKYIPQALNAIAYLIIAVNDDNKPVAFMGIEERKLEMLFVPPNIEEKDWGNSSCSMA